MHVLEKYISATPALTDVRTQLICSEVNSQGGGNERLKSFGVLVKQRDFVVKDSALCVGSIEDNINDEHNGRYEQC
jgi:hypothetical protein